jgi:hypothetical protein
MSLRFAATLSDFRTILLTRLSSGRPLARERASAAQQGSKAGDDSRYDGAGRRNTSGPPATELDVTNPAAASARSNSRLCLALAKIAPAMSRHRHESEQFKHASGRSASFTIT